jgi:hypothetical protein
MVKEKKMAECKLSNKMVVLFVLGWAFLVGVIFFGVGLKEKFSTFPYENTKARPECCSGNNDLLSTSTGCFCLSEEEKMIIFTRGGNRS